MWKPVHERVAELPMFEEYGRLSNRILPISGMLEKRSRSNYEENFWNVLPNRRSFILILPSGNSEEG
jgi:hypothetical protein